MDHLRPFLRHTPPWYSRPDQRHRHGGGDACTGKPTHSLGCTCPPPVGGSGVAVRTPPQKHLKNVRTQAYCRGGRLPGKAPCSPSPPAPSHNLTPVTMEWMSPLGLMCRKAASGQSGACPRLPNPFLRLRCCLLARCLNR